MGFEIEKDAEVTPNGSIVADRRLYVTADEKTLVEHGHEAGRFLLAAPGHTIPAKKVKELGLAVVDGRVVQPGAEGDVGDKTETDDKSGEKQQGKKADKSRAPKEDK